MVSEKVATQVARLEIGKDQEGRIKSQLDSQEQIDHFAEILTEHKQPVTISNTADCMDDRPTISLADGTTDQGQLAERVTYQLPGGLGLAIAKAAVAANAAFVRDAHDFKSAYILTSDLLKSLDYEDGGHEKCGASANVENSIASTVAEPILIPTVGAVVRLDDSNLDLFAKIQRNKHQKLEQGFYGSWDSGWHEDFLSQRYPQNFSKLKTASDVVHGHYAQGAFIIEESGMGFAKNAFYNDTSEMAFGITSPNSKFIIELVNILSGIPEERVALLLALPDDLVNVSDKLLAPGMPVFADAA